MQHSRSFRLLKTPHFLSQFSHGLLQLGFIPTSQRGLYRRDPVEARHVLTTKKEERRLRVAVRATRNSQAQYTPYDRPTASALSALGKLDKGVRAETCGCGFPQAFALAKSERFRQPSTSVVYDGKHRHRRIHPSPFLLFLCHSCLDAHETSACNHRLVLIG